MKYKIDPIPGICAWCSSPSVAKQGRIFLCEKHYRFQQMRVHAKRNGKSVPEYSWLEANIPKEMICPCCSVTMNWRANDNHKTVITLQHDRSGAHRLICMSCNARHMQLPDDTFYYLPKGHKRCPSCKNVLSMESFGIALDGKRWGNRRSYCYECVREVANKYRLLHKDEINRKKRVARATLASKKIKEGRNA